MPDEIDLTDEQEAALERAWEKLEAKKAEKPEKGENPNLFDEDTASGE